MIDDALLGRARASADRAAARAAVVIRPLDTMAEFVACDALYSEIWGPGGGPPANELRAHRSAGSYVVGAFDGDALIGGCLGFWGPPDRRSRHSHIAGVSTAARGRDLGYALKLDQRADALGHGVELITWTFDPLIARNAHFNLHKLGGRAAKYMINYYGVMPDAINAGDETDRILLHWDLAGDRVAAACDEPAVEGDAPRRESRFPETDSRFSELDSRFPELVEGPVPALVGIPGDIEGLRRTDPEVAQRWRHTLRDRLAPIVNGGGRIIDFDRRRGGYLVSEELS